MRKIKNTQMQLSNWSKSTFGNMNKKIMELQDTLQHLQKPSHQVLSKEKVIKHELEFLLQCEEKKGPRRHRNTHYFHTMINHQRQIGKISPVRINDSDWTNDPQYFDNVTFQSLLSLYNKNLVIIISHNYNNKL